MMENTAQHNRPVFIFEASVGQIVEIPLESDGTLPMSSLNVYFPGDTEQEFLLDSDSPYGTPSLLDGEFSVSDLRFDCNRSKGVKRKFDEFDNKQSNVCHNIKSNCTELLNMQQRNKILRSISRRQRLQTPESRQQTTGQLSTSDDYVTDNLSIQNLDDAIEIALQIHFDGRLEFDDTSMKIESNAECNLAYAPTLHHQQLIPDTSMPEYGTVEYHNILENMKQEPDDDNYDEPLPGTSLPGNSSEDIHYYLLDDTEQEPAIDEYDEPRFNKSPPAYGSEEFIYKLKNIKLEPVDDEYD